MTNKTITKNDKFMKQMINGLAKYRNMDYMPYKDIQGVTSELPRLMKLMNKQQLRLANVNYNVHHYYTDDKKDYSLHKAMKYNREVNQWILHIYAGLVGTLSKKQLINKYVPDKSYVKGYIGNK